MNLLKLIEEFINEDVALTKGSQRVMNNKNLVADLADAIRDDVRTNPSVFPPNSNRIFQKSPDEELAKWFLENIDKIEKEGYEGTIYSRDGVNNEWIVRRYIAGSHNWEDIIGVMNMNLRDWSLLKNRNSLQPGHTDIPKFNSVRDIGKYMSTHYFHTLADIRDAAALAAVKKQAKTAKIVDNEDYKIYTVFNWAGARVLGNGTQWCTSNSKNDVNYRNYSGAAMLFQLFPKEPEIVDKISGLSGKHIKGPEKYQFDGGSGSFKDIADDTVESPHYISNKFPYLYTDLITGLKQHKGEIQDALDKMADDKTLQTQETKVNKYNIDDEIKKLKNLKNLGYFTDLIRPKSPTATPNNEEGQMEGIKKLAQEMLEDIQINEGPGRWPDQAAARRNAAQAGYPITGTITRTPTGIIHKGGDAYSGEWLDKLPPGMTEYEGKPMQSFKPPRLASTYSRLNKDQAGIHPDEVDEEDEGLAAAATGGELGTMGGGPTGGGKYPPGTAPTMPESFKIIGNEIMENIDKDVADMLSSLKKYDKLTESIAPVLGMKTLGEKKEEVEEHFYYNVPTNKSDAFDKAESDAAKKKKKEQDLDWKKHKKGKLPEEVNEEADLEIISWMKRFSKLGNMKGYGK